MGGPEQGFLRLGGQRSVGSEGGSPRGSHRRESSCPESLPGAGSELGWQSQTPPALPSTPQPGPCPPPRAWELHPRRPLGPGEEARPRGPREPSSHTPPVCLPPAPGRGFSPPRIRLLLRCGQHRARVWAQPPGQETPQGAAHLRSCPQPHAGWTRGREFILLPQIPTPWTETEKREPGSLPSRGLRFPICQMGFGRSKSH